MVNLLIGKLDELDNVDNTKSSYFKSIYDFDTLKFQIINPSFDELQNLALNELNLKYPDITFEIV